MAAVFPSLNPFAIVTTAASPCLSEHSIARNATHCSTVKNWSAFPRKQINSKSRTPSRKRATNGARPFLAISWTLYGFKFGVGFAVLILVHELGHYLDIRRRGLPPDMPVFLPGLGAYVRWEAMGVTRQTRAAVSLAGPLAGLLGTAVCAYLWHHTGYGLWSVLASVSGVLNLLNLTPVWILGGGQAMNALSKAERFVLLAWTLALWAFLDQGLFFLVAAGITYRLFTKDLPPIPNPRIAVYYASLLIGLGVILYIIPGQGLLPGSSR
jgi:Zn-dependent protease